MVSGAVLAGAVQFIFCVLLDVFLFDVSVIVAFQARASNQDEKDAEESEGAKHHPAQNATTVSDEEHGGEEKVEETLASNSL